MKLRKFLVVRADGEARVVARTPRLRLDEFAYRLNISIPDSWAAVVGDINIALPDPDMRPSVEIERDVSADG